ncbi:MAG TPA: hypothetical protein VKV23_00285 [Acidimicrobiales bacterium]|nr:hypothetical protein [Acidimicrobiales bacterium]
MTASVAAVAATLVALCLSLSTFERYLTRRARHELAFALAFLAFALASGALALGSTSGFDGPTFRLFYLVGAIVDVPVLALGTVYLHLRTRVGDWFALGVAAWTVAAAVVMATAPFTHPLPAHGLPQGSAVLGPLPRALAGVGSGGGTAVILAGTILSAARRRRGPVAVGNVLIAAGTLITGASGVANSAFGAMTAFAVALGVGVAVIFAGFLVVASTRPVGAAQPASVKRAAR